MAKYVLFYIGFEEVNERSEKTSELSVSMEKPPSKRRKICEGGFDSKKYTVLHRILYIMYIIFYTR